jgi:hypothetical protein
MAKEALIEVFVVGASNVVAAVVLTLKQAVYMLKVENYLLLQTTA